MAIPELRPIDAALGVGLGSFAPAMLVLNDRLLLAFGGRDVSTRYVRRVIVEARGLLQVRYGHPNDEASDGHTLAAYGLGECWGSGVEVINSPWLAIAEVNAANRVAFPDFTFTARHFVLPFKELTVEILCDSLSAYPADDGRLTEFARLARFWAEEA